jgi:phage terminase large subunit
MEDDKARDYQLYEHVWLGMPLKVSAAIIFSGRYRVARFPKDLWREAGATPHQGIDWGFAQDPFCFVRNFALEQDDVWARDGKRRLFVPYACYKVGLEIRDTARFIGNRVPDAREWPVKADGARPEMISDLRREGGFAVSAAEKWDGCVKDGIAHLRGFDEIVVHEDLAHPAPDAATCLAEEARLYRYKTDPRQVDENGQPQVLPVVVDRYNHGWDAIRYSLDGYIMRGGDLGIWARLGSDGAGS